MQFAIERLQTERTNWRKDHPPKFIARPQKKPDGSLNLFVWDCLIPGPSDSPWEGGYFPLMLTFPENYPTKPPAAKFIPPVPHVNVFPSGTVCLSILHDDEGWKPSLNLRQILMGIQNLLITPNPESPAHELHFRNFMMDKVQYTNNIINHTRRFPNPTLP